METLYLDESGRFEGGKAAPRTTFVGGFLTTEPPARVLGALAKLRDDLGGDPLLAQAFPRGAQPGRLHATELRRTLGDPGLDRLRELASRRLRDLSGFRLVSTHYFGDAHVSMDQVQDARGVNRFLRMWQATVRNVLHHQPWLMDPDDAGLVVHTAQRSVPLGDLGSDDQVALMTLPRVTLGSSGEGLRIASNEQLPAMLLGIVGRGSSSPFSRRFDGARVGPSLASITDRDLERAPEDAGLLLADLACDLIRARLAEESGPDWFRVAYDPRWERYERLCEAAHESPRALGELFDLTDRPTPGDEVERWLQEAARRLLQSLVQHARTPKSPTRPLLLRVARGELDRKEGAFPRCDRILGPGGLDRPGVLDAQAIDEWILRTAYQNHTGRDAGGARNDAVARVRDLFARDAEAFFSHGEGLAHLAVSYQDEHDHDQAEEAAQAYLVRAEPIFASFRAATPEATWTTLGRVQSNLAQTLAYRQAEGDLTRAVELVRRARPHMTSPRDLSQWGCHAGNLAVLVGDDALLDECLALPELFGTAEVEGLVRTLRATSFGPNDSTVRLFSFTVATRVALLGVGRCRLAAPLRAALSEPVCWAELWENVRRARPAHPIERYARHLLELAPADERTAEAPLLALACNGFGNREPSRVAELSRAGTLAAFAARLFRTSRAAEGRRRAAEAAEVFLAPFAADPYVSTSTYWEDAGQGWFHDAVQALRRDPSMATVEGFLERFRYEWR